MKTYKLKKCDMNYEELTAIRVEVDRFNKVLQEALDKAMLIEDVEGYTEDQLEEFLRYTFRDNGFMSSKNPFYGQRNVEPIFGTFEWEKLTERSKE